MPVKLIGRQSKTDALRAGIVALAQELGPGARLPTVVQLRDRFGVSLATLDNALGALEAQNVLRRRHGVGVFVSPNLHQRAICLIQDPAVAAGGSPFWDLLIDQARRRAAAGNEAFSLHYSVPNGVGDAPLHEGLMQDTQGGRVQGVLSVGLRPEASDWIRRQGVPFVAFAGHAEWMVALDGAELVRQGVAQLVNQGCRRIGLWASVPADRSAGDGSRAESETRVFFQRELAAHGLPYDDTLVQDDPPETPTGVPREQGYHAARRVFGDGGHPRPDGVLITDDMMTLGALIGLQNLGISVGKDVQVASHANRGSTVLLGQEDALTRLEIDPAEVAQAMFGLLETLMNGDRPAQAVTWIQPTVRSRHATK